MKTAGGPPSSGTRNKCRAPLLLAAEVINWPSRAQAEALASRAYRLPWGIRAIGLHHVQGCSALLPHRECDVLSIGGDRRAANSVAVPFASVQIPSLEPVAAT
jgi:hypothetical protein